MRVQKVDPNDIAKCALQHYHNKLSQGKPRPEDEWTIYAAIVAAQDDGSLQVISCATGSKCTTVGPDGWVLRDSHAEVLCRRGLIRLMLQEHEGKLQFLEKCHQGTYRFKATLHLYVSHSPCGDASIYPLIQEEMNFTGAKVIVRKDDSDSSHHNELLPMNNDDCCVAREGIQELGVLRTKSGRSNLPSHLRSTSMSCSDKLLRWCVLGLQGSWSKGEPVRLSSIVASRDPHAISVDCQQKALERAVCGRIRQVVKELQSRDLSEEQGDFVNKLSKHAISVYVVDEQFPDGRKAELSIAEPSQVAKIVKRKMVETTSSVEKNASNKRKRESSVELSSKNKKSVCGVSINWQISSQETEIVVGARGIRQGKKPKSNQDFMRQTSRLSRGALMRLTNPTTHKRAFREFKSLLSQEGYSDIRNLVLSTKPFQGWLAGTSDFTISEFL